MSPHKRDCAVCGFSTENSEIEYCPKDGKKLRRRISRPQG